MTKPLTVPYRRFSEYVGVDLAQLRPHGSYGKLIANRTHALDTLIARFGTVPQDLLVRRPCPTCAADHSTHELTKDHLALVRCLECGLVYVNPIFDEQHYKEVYGSATYQAIMKDLGEASHEYRVERFGRERVEVMGQHLEGVAQPRYLDVGCSTGFVVEAATQRGWRAEGIDLNPSAIEFGQRRGLNLRVAALEEAGVAPGSLDAISLFDVLEHLARPAEVVVQAAGLLRPGGVLYLYVPNYDSASRLLMGADAHFIWPTHHLNYYTPATLSDLVARHGLETALMQTEGLDIADYVWQRRELHGEDVSAVERIGDVLQFLANAGAYGKNLRLLARRVRV
ncbi:MAG: methyltransferase domain-containing protein [Acidobacteriota bacterium]